MAIDIETVKGYFNHPDTVLHYCRAVGNVGLWKSEASLFAKWFRLEDRILDVGCGAGRIALGLWGNGYRSVEGMDLAVGMVAEAREFAEALDARIVFRQGDATCLSYADGAFDAAVFGFNGLMQIPGRTNRRKALAEIRRVLKPGGRLIFSTLDREDALYRSVFSRAGDLGHDPLRNPGVAEMGDRHFATDHGQTFMHVPDQKSVREDLESTGFELLESRARSSIAAESAATLEFSEDCRFWVVRAP